MDGQVKQKALIAEDDRALADILRIALNRLGMDVTVAHDGHRALTLARNTAFDLIVTDYQMPKLDGEQLLREIRKGTVSSEACVILCSAKAYEIDSEQITKELRLSAIFYKPFSLSELSRFVRELQLCSPPKSAEHSNETEPAGVGSVGGNLS